MAKKSKKVDKHRGKCGVMLFWLFRIDLWSNNKQDQRYRKLNLWCNITNLSIVFVIIPLYYIVILFICRTTHIVRHAKNKD